jgi:hypothetical protein
MDLYRRSGMAAGILLIVATAAGVAALSTQPFMDAPDYLARISASEPGVLISALLILVMGLACAGIAIAMYPVLRKCGEGMALGAAGFRIMEGVFHCLGAVLVLLMASLSREFVKAGTAEAAAFQGLGALLVEARSWVGSVAATLCWCVGAFLYYVLFFKAKLVPRWLSLWGLVGIALAFAACLLILFRLTTDKEALHSLLNLPVAIQEMVLAVWLIAKGFNPSPVEQGGRP